MRTWTGGTRPRPGTKDSTLNFIKMLRLATHVPQTLNLSESEACCILFSVRLCVLGLVLFVSVSDTAFARMVQDPGMVGSSCAQQFRADSQEREVSLNPKGPKP